jgi:hypothetical protein
MRRFEMAVVCTLFLFGLSGCGQEPEGPAEQVGKEIDATVEQTEEKIDEAVDTAAKKVEQAGDELRRSTTD